MANVDFEIQSVLMTATHNTQQNANCINMSEDFHNLLRERTWHVLGIGFAGILSHSWIRGGGDPVPAILTTITVHRGNNKSV